MLNQPGLKIGQVKNGKARIPRMTPEFALTPASSAPEIATAYWESRLDPRGGSGSHRGPPTMVIGRRSAIRMTRTRNSSATSCTGIATIERKKVAVPPTPGRGRRTAEVFGAEVRCEIAPMSAARLGPFPNRTGHDKLSTERLGGMTNATAGVHSRARWVGGCLAARGARAVSKCKPSAPSCGAGGVCRDPPHCEGLDRSFSNGASGGWMEWRPCGQDRHSVGRCRSRPHPCECGGDRIFSS
jgi:hypothetical protein